MNKLRIFTSVLCIGCSLNPLFSQTKSDSIPLSGNELIGRGVELYDNGKPEEALNLYKKVSLADPGYSKALYESALAYDNLGKGELALQKCQEAVELQPDNVQFSILKGSILDELGRTGDAIQWLEALKLKHPYNQNLLYNLAICYINKRQYLKAEALLIKGLHYNPYHTNSHIALGKINYIFGRKAQSYLAYNMGILMNPRVEYIRNLEEAICGRNDSISKSYLYPYPSQLNHSQWDNLTGLLDAEVAFRNDFPYEYKLNFLCSRQTYLLVKKMQFDEKDTTFYNQFYVRFFKSLSDKKMFETYLYYSLKGTDNKPVAEWNEQNGELIKKFIDYSREAINSWKAYGFSTANESKHQKIFHFDSDDDLEAIGTLDENAGPSKEGLWYFTSPRGNIDQKGNYRKNLRQGEFLIYWPNGSIKQRLNYNNGKLDGNNYTFHPNGARSGIYPRKDGVSDGVEEEFNSAEQLFSSIPYRKDKIDGNMVFVDFNNGYQRNIPYVENKRSGLAAEQWLNKNKKLEAVYADSLLNGSFKKWYSNGQPEWEGNYTKGIQTGKWTSYYADGKKSAEGECDEQGKPTGSYREYDHDGKLAQLISGYNNGKQNGSQTFYYPDGKEWARFAVQDNVIKHIEWLNPLGEKIYSDDEKNGEINYKAFFPEGSLKTEGIYRNGSKEGVWKNYNIFGKLISEESWLNGLNSGVQKTYYDNGNEQLVYSCDSGMVVGKVSRFYSDGHISMSGYYSKKGLTSEWIEYYPNDTVEYRYYYNEGTLVGRRFNYSPEGKIVSEETFNSDGESTRLRYFDSTGKVIDDLNYPYGKESFTLHFPNGKMRAKFTISDRKRDGIQEFYFPNGKLLSQKTFISGNKQGKSTEWDFRGKLVETKNFSLNALDGYFTRNERNGSSVIRTYRIDDNEGYYTELHPNGKVFRRIAVKSGERQGRGDCYAPDSTLMYSVQYRDDRMFSLSYIDAQGKMHTNELIDNSTKEIVCYFKNGKISARLPFSNCIFNGKHTIFYSNGQPLQEVSYLNDYRHGQSKYYYESGKIKEVCDWLNGIQNGRYVSYYANGQKEMEGSYIVGKRQGKWITYNEDGKPSETLNFNNDELYEVN